MQKQVNFYNDLRMVGLTHDQCSEVCEMVGNMETYVVIYYWGYYEDRDFEVAYAGTSKEIAIEKGKSRPQTISKYDVFWKIEVFVNGEKVRGVDGETIERTGEF